MIGRLLNGAWTMLVYACVGTVISQAIVLLILAATWKIDQKRWLIAVAALQGIGPAETAQLPEREADKTAPEQPSYEQILEARAVKSRDLELRESEMRNSLSQIQFEQTKLAEDKKRYKQLRDEFNGQLLSTRDGATASGKDEVRRTLENIKPKQAKALILEMLDNKELDDVVALLLPMPDNKRARIFGEFKQEDELKRLSVLLRRIREGLPASKASEAAIKQLEQLKIPQS